MNFEDAFRYAEPYCNFHYTTDKIAEMRAAAQAMDEETRSVVMDIALLYYDIGRASQY